MSRLTVWEAAGAAGTPVLRTEDAAEIAAALASVGVRFERWDSPVTLPDDAPADAVLAAYRPHLDALMDGRAGTADVVAMTPAHPQREALRAKFLDEHIHTEDEVRFFVRGAGNFVIHAGGRVYDARCTAGDLISVPANLKHWFDAGEAPDFVALRVFTETTGWTPHYTGSDMSARFPAHTA